MQSAPQYKVLSYYMYTPMQNAEEFAQEHLEYCKRLGVLGRILIADEGMNGTLAGSHLACERYMDFVRSLPGFADVAFKVHDSQEMPFRRISVRFRTEIVNSGLAEISHIDPAKKTGKHLAPAEFKKLKDSEDVVVLDVRSNYETTLGKFKNAVTLNIENFREFPEKVQELEKFKNKKILTYCTGGVKCEKASAYLLEKGFKDVYQLHGGILAYGEEAGGEDFEGKCYVFDGRIAVDVNKVNPAVISKCIHCGTTTDRMVNCANALCNDQIVICEQCGWAHNGVCSTDCGESHGRRPYTGSGQYKK